MTPEAIPAVLGLIVLVAGLLQNFYGMVGCGRLIKFIPYPVNLVLPTRYLRHVFSNLPPSDGRRLLAFSNPGRTTGLS